MSIETQTPEPVGEAGPRPGDWTGKHSDSAPVPPLHPTDAFHQAMVEFAKLREFAAYYVATRLDAVRLMVRRLGLAAGIMVIAAVGVLAIIVTAVVLLMRGIAGGLVELFPRYPWLGDLIVGVVFLIVPLLAVMMGMRWVTRTFKSLTVQKYEARQRQQRQHFGSDVRDQATAAPGPAGKAH